MRRQEYPSADRCPYLWLALSALVGLFTYGAWLVPLAAWIAPIFTLRFFRTQGPMRGFLLALPVTAATLAFLLRDLAPIPGVAYVVFVVVAAAFGLLPYLLDRLLAPRLPAFAATLVLPLAAVCLEFANAQGEWGTWGSTAYTQAANLPFSQVISIAGLWGLVFLMTWPASLVNWAWEQGWHWERVRGGVLLYTGVLVAVLGFGYARLASTAAGDPVRVAAIPAASPLQSAASEALLLNILGGAGESAQTEARALFVANNDAMLERSAAEARSGARIVFWAEAGAFVFADDEAALIARGKALAREHGIYLGMAMGVVQPDAAMPLQNKIVLVTPQGEVGFTYHKVFPVPGQEARVVERGVAQIPALDTPYGRIGAVICFDMDHHHYLQQAGDQGIDVLFAPSNDWPAIARLHADMARTRAIEQGFTLVRPTNNGLSLAADPYGRTLAESDYWRTGGASLTVTVPVGATPTLYARIGDAPAYAAAVALALLGLWGAGSLVYGLTRVARRRPAL